MMNSLLSHTCLKHCATSRLVLLSVVRSTGQDSQQSNQVGQKSQVVNLYKNLIFLSRDWPTDLRPQIKKAFVKNRDVKDPEEVRKLLDKGEYICREITATYSLKKYRAMKRRYYSDDQDKHLQELIDSYK